MFEEVSTLLIAALIAGALLAVGAVVLSYFNPQQPLDYAYAAFAPLVKPVNNTHVQLGVAPLGDRVEVTAVAWEKGTTRAEVPLRVAAKNETWLTYGGKPLAVPCGANVTVVTKYGTASRALSFHVACLQREVEITSSTESLLQQMLDYAAYVGNYLIYKSVPVISAYFRYIYDSPVEGAIGLQNIVPFPLAIYNVDFQLPGGVYVDYHPVVGPHSMVLFMPREAKYVYYLDTTAYRFKAYRWLHVVAYWNDTLTVWINGVLVYNGTFGSFSTTSPQGFQVSFDSASRKLSVTLVDEYDKKNTISIDVKPGVSEWRGWAYWGDVWFSDMDRSFVKDIYVMPAGVRAGEYIGIIPAFRVYSVYAAYNGSGVAASWLDPNCGFDDTCLRTAFYAQPGVYQIPDTGVTLIWNSTGIYLRNQYGQVTREGSIPFKSELDLSNAYVYKLNFTTSYREKLLYCQTCGSFQCCYYNATATGILTLAYGNQTVALDAYYGHAVRMKLFNTPPGPGGESLSLINFGSSGCYPRIVTIPLGQRHKNLEVIRQDGKIAGYKVAVVNVYKDVIYGCDGNVRERVYEITVGVYTVNGASYHVIDPNQNTCGFYSKSRPQNQNGVVYCTSPWT